MDNLPNDLAEKGYGIIRENIGKFQSPFSTGYASIPTRPKIATPPTNFFSLIFFSSKSQKVGHLLYHITSFRILARHRFLRVFFAFILVEKHKYARIQKMLVRVLMTNDENTDLLLGLGLTLNQAKVYLAILKLEKTTVGQVANFSKCVEKMSIEFCRRLKKWA